MCGRAIAGSAGNLRNWCSVPVDEVRLRSLRRPNVRPMMLGLGIPSRAFVFIRTYPPPPFAPRAATPVGSTEYAHVRTRRRQNCRQVAARSPLADPLFLASSVFVKKSQRIMAPVFIMVLCLLVYWLAEVHARLAVAQQSVTDQLRRPTTRLTMRWLFQCFEGIGLHHLTVPYHGPRTTQVLRLSAPHRPARLRCWAACLVAGQAPGPNCSGAVWCACSSPTMSPGASTPSATCLTEIARRTHRGLSPSRQAGLPGFSPCFSDSAVVHSF
jgi:hypothetical protein